MNFNEIGEEIAIIKDNDNKKKKQLKVYITDDEDEHKHIKFFKELELSKNEKFYIIPDIKGDRDAIYIVGKNGSGKSYWIRDYVINYHNIHKKKPIYLFSSKKEDKNLDDLKYIKRVELDESFVENPLEYEELQDTFCIFDDIDALKGKLKDEIYYLRDTILNNGRSYKIDIISTSHDACGKINQTALNESHKIVFFLKNYNRTMKYFLEGYIGLEKEQIKKLRDNKTRATTFIKSYPNVIIQERNAYILKDL